MSEILILFYSRGGSVAQLARHHRAWRRRSTRHAGAAAQRAAGGAADPALTAPPVPADGAPYANHADLAQWRGSDPRQPDPLRQHGRAAEIFLDGTGATGLPARWSASRRPCSRRPQPCTADRKHAAVDDAAAAASRLRMVGIPYTELRCRAPAAAARHTVPAMLPATRTMPNRAKTNARWRAPSANGWRRSHSAWHCDDERIRGFARSAPEVRSKRAAIASVFALWLLLHGLWHAWLLPGAATPPVVAGTGAGGAARSALRLLATLRRRPSAAFWAGFAGLDLLQSRGDGGVGSAEQPGACWDGSRSRSHSPPCFSVALAGKACARVWPAGAAARKRVNWCDSGNPFHGAEHGRALIVTTGGTIDKIYFDDKSDFQIGEPQIGRILHALGVGSVDVIPLLRKDSLHDQ